MSVITCKAEKEEEEEEETLDVDRTMPVAEKNLVILELLADEEVCAPPPPPPLRFSSAPLRIVSSMCDSRGSNRKLKRIVLIYQGFEVCL